MTISNIEVILYVADQQKSTDFYTTILQREPEINVPGMTEFRLSQNLKLGLMPEKGIATILGNKTPHPNEGNGIPRCEIYLVSDNVTEMFETAIKAGAKEVSPIAPRDWGDSVGYVADLDGHILAFAKREEYGW